MHYAPFTLAIKRFFERVLWSGEKLPVVFAGPDRAFQELERVQKRRAQGKTSRATGRKGATKQGIGDQPAHVPFVSVLVQPFSFEPQRFNPASFRGITKDLQTGCATTMRYPRPVTADVQADFWAGSVGGWQVVQHLAAQVELLFVAESAYLPIDWDDPNIYKPPFDIMEGSRPMGRTRFRLVTQGWSDSSDLEAGDGPKSVRWTWTGRAEGYLPHRLEQARIVRTIPLDIVDASDPTLPVLDTLIGGVED